MQFKMVDHPGAATTLVVQDDKVLLVESSIDRLQDA